MNQSQQPTPERTTLWKQHPLLLIATGFIILTAVVLSVLPLVIKNTMSNTLSDLGAQNVSIDDVDFNLFSSELVIKKIRYENTDFKPFVCKRAAVNIDLLPIFSNRFYIHSLSLDNCELDVLISEQNTLLLNGLALPPNQKATDEEPVAETGETAQWLLGLNHFNLSEILITYKDQKIGSKIYIKNFALNDMLQWQPELSSPISFSMEVNDKPFTLQGTMQPFHSDRNFVGKLSLSEFDIKPFAALAKTEQFELLDGSVTTELALTSSVNKNNDYQLDIDGFVKSTNLNLTVSSDAVSYKDLQWNGKLQFMIDQQDKAISIFTDNDLVIDDFSYSLKQQQFDIGSDTISFKGQFSQDARDKSGQPMHVGGEVGIRDLSVTDTVNKILITNIGEIEAKNFDISNTKYYFPGISISNTKALGATQNSGKNAKNKSEYLATLANLSVNELQIENLQSITITSIKTTDLVGQLIIDEQGNLKYIKQLQQADNSKQAVSQPEQNKEKEPADQQDEASKDITFKIGVIETQGNNQFTFQDLSVSPKFKINFRDIMLKLVSIDSGNPANKTQISFSTKIDEAGSANYAGESQPFSKQLTTDIKGKINNLELHTLTSYSLPATGRKIRHGTLDADISFIIQNRKLDNELNFTISKLSLIKDDDKIAQQYDAAMPLPMETAIDFLKDKKERIKISVPVKGDIDNPDFHYMPAVNMAIRKTLQSAALSYIKYTLQPWGTLISVGELIAGQMSKIEFEPVVFSPGQTQLLTDQIQYLDKMAKLLQEKPNMSLTICGVATAQDKKALASKPQAPKDEKKAPKVEQEQDPLLLLADQRALSVKNYFTKTKQIARERLRNCSPVYKDEQSAKPMVELLF